MMMIMNLLWWMMVILMKSWGKQYKTDSKILELVYKLMVGIWILVLFKVKDKLANLLKNFNQIYLL